MKGRQMGARERAGGGRQARHMAVMVERTDAASAAKARSVRTSE